MILEYKRAFRVAAVPIGLGGGLAAGVDRNELVKWMTIGIFGLFGLYTVGLALLIEITGI